MEELDTDIDQFLEWLLEGSNISCTSCASDNFDADLHEDAHYLMNAAFDNSTQSPTKRRRRTELQRLERHGWSRVQDNPQGPKRRRFHYIGPDGAKTTSLKKAMKAIAS